MQSARVEELDGMNGLEALDEMKGEYSALESAGDSLSIRAGQSYSKSV